ncbi:MAG: glycosyltransferase, partial [Bacteroidales bacterium]
MTGDLKRVLIVIPAYNEAARLPPLLVEVAAYLRSDAPARARLDAHFLVVDDGSAMEEFQAVKCAVAQHGLPALDVMRLERNQGKGAAIRAGFERGLDRGDAYLAFMDADASVPVREAHRVIVHLADAPPGTLSGVIGSR